MLVKEYRLILPFTLPEYKLAQLYMLAKSSLDQAGLAPGEGIQVVKNEPFSADHNNPWALPPGQYTEKILRLKSHFPRFIRAIIPDAAMLLVERSWNAYPRCVTVYDHKWLGDGFHMTVESLHVQDRGNLKNALQLSSELLAARQVDYINIAGDTSYLPFRTGEDPTCFSSRITGRGPLPADFAKTAEPVMCAYKVVKLHCKLTGVQAKIEAWGHAVGIRNPLLEHHRKLFCWMDDWFEMGIEDIRKMEHESAKMSDMRREESASEAIKKDKSTLQAPGGFWSRKPRSLAS